MAPLITATIDSEGPAGVLALLRGTRGTLPAPATAEVGEFFGPAIRLHDLDDEPGDSPLPYLAVLWSAIRGSSQLGTVEQALLRVSLEIRLPLQAQRLPSIAPPAAPSVAAVAGGTTIAAGTYYCGLTSYTAAGESYGSAVSTVTVGAGQQIRWSSVPASTRLWRSSVGRRDVRYLDVRSAATYDDDHADTYLGDALFPEQGLGHRLYGAVCRILTANRFVPDASGEPLTDSGVRFGEPSIRRDAARNCKRIRWTAEWSEAHDIDSREAE